VFDVDVNNIINSPMKKHLASFTSVLFLLLVIVSGCNGQETKLKTNQSPAGKRAFANYKEGTDYFLFDRVRILDKTGFNQPAEAYSILLPKSWQQQSQVIWNTPGSACAGTYKWLKAQSPDGTMSFETYPDAIYSWSTNKELMKFNENNQSSSPDCGTGQPINAEDYLRKVFGPNILGNPEIIKVTSNDAVVQEMQQSNEKTKAEMMRFGSAANQFYQTAINAEVRWPDGTGGQVVLAITTLETVVPNVYNGTYDKAYTTQVMKRTVFKYPASRRQQAINQFCMIMGSFRTNPVWSKAVSSFWVDYREKRRTANIGRIAIMDAETQAIGNRAIQSGKDRLATMDTEMRSWEQRQASKDRTHTNFIKTIREVENYKDATGKIELASSYGHAWSRGDGTSFIMSNSASFDPSTVYQDQQWKEMRKVD
jgi:hypothetical protein